MAGEGAVLQDEYAAWARAAAQWLDRIDACIAGRLMPQDVAALHRDCDSLQESLAALGARLRRLPPGAAKPQVDFDALARRIAADQMKPLGDRILAQFPAPGAVGLEPPAAAAFNLAAACDLLALLERAAARLFHRPAGPAQRRRLAKRLAALGERYHRQVMDGFVAVDAPAAGAAAGLREAVPAGPPDGGAAGRDSLRVANFNQIRMDLLQWLLEALHDPAAAERIRHLSRITARAAVRRVDGDLQAYLASHEPETRARLRPVLESVDEVLALVRGVLQQSEEHRDGGAMRHFVSDLGAEAAEPFIRDMGLLVIALFDDLQAAAGQCLLTAAALRGALQRVDAALAFCRLVAHPLGRDAHARALRVVRIRSDALTAALERCMQPQAGADQAEARAALTVLRDFIERTRAQA